MLTYLKRLVNMLMLNRYIVVVQLLISDKYEVQLRPWLPPQKATGDVSLDFGLLQKTPEE